MHQCRVCIRPIDDDLMFFAHSLEQTSESCWQPLAEHLRQVADLASARGSKFRAGEAAFLAGLLHDLGKYTIAFQRRLAGAGERVDHSTAGAQEAVRLAANADDRLIAHILAHAIAGHHAGLPDSVGVGDDRSLEARLKKRIEPVDPVWRDEIGAGVAALMPPGFHWIANDRDALARQLAFFGRMLFSCLVDADYRDTEHFYAEAEGRQVDRRWPALPEIAGRLIADFDAHMTQLSAKAEDSPVNRLRAEIFAHVRARGAAAEQGLFTLTVPTGGGKTLASLAFALEHAKRHGLERIVYAIPFTSIIDQTAGIFREVLGDEVVLEHHSSIDEQRIEDEDRKHRREAKDKLKLAMEDWAAPIVVTTNVQLFESLHSNRPSRCRRLHNLAKSVIVLDEAQTIPLHVLRPCLAAIEELARNYSASVVLCTATQPAVGAAHFKGGLPFGADAELAPDPPALHEKLKRVRLVHLGEKSDCELVDALAEVDQGLVIVNSRAHALALHREAVERGLDGVMHLTTRQYAAHRRRILADVRKRLDRDNPKPCRLIATSLVEAGVDLDFPRVWRAEAGLDQIAQAAGRCNREGRRPIDESVVGIFRPVEHRPPREIAQLSADMGRMVHRHADLLSPDAMRDYFGEVYWRKGETLDRDGVMEKWRLSQSARGKHLEASFGYRVVAENFRLIESGLAPVIVAKEDEPRETLAALRRGLPPGAAAQQLQSYIVQVPPRARDLLIANGRARYVEGDKVGDPRQFVELVSAELYRDEAGLLWENVEYLDSEQLIV